MVTLRRHLVLPVPPQRLVTIPHDRVLRVILGWQEAVLGCGQAEAQPVRGVGAVGSIVALGSERRALGGDRLAPRRQWVQRRLPSEHCHWARTECNAYTMRVGSRQTDAPGQYRSGQRSGRPSRSNPSHPRSGL